VEQTNADLEGLPNNKYYIVLKLTIL